MASLVETTGIQYKLALRAMAMIDGGPPSGLSLTERLQKLKTFKYLWSHASVSLMQTISPSRPREVRNWSSKNGVLPFVISKELRLLRPSSSVRGIEERMWTLDLSQIDYHFDMCAVDVAQDLLVLSERPLIHQ